MCPTTDRAAAASIALRTAAATSCGQQSGQLVARRLVGRTRCESGERSGELVASTAARGMRDCKASQQDQAARLRRAVALCGTGSLRSLGSSEVACDCLALHLEFFGARAKARKQLRR